MQKPPMPAAAGEVVELLRRAVNEGHAVILPRLADQHIDLDPPLVATFSHLLGLRRGESRLLLKLVTNAFVHKNSLNMSRSHANVLVCSLRKKLPPHIEIVTLYGQGFRLTEESHDLVRKLLVQSGIEPPPDITPP